MQVARGVMLASKQGHHEVVTMLMAAGAPVQHILIRAASVGDSEQLLVLLKAGAAADTEVASEAMLERGPLTRWRLRTQPSPAPAARRGLPCGAGPMRMHSAQ